jgi:transcriptional regulator with XRE-family HTH domain
MKFADTLRKLRTKAKMTRFRLAQNTRVDPAHVARLERGERLRPSRDLVLRMAQALLDYSGDIRLKDVDQLLQSAGYGPLPGGVYYQSEVGALRTWADQGLLLESPSPSLSCSTLAFQ